MNKYIILITLLLIEHESNNKSKLIYSIIIFNDPLNQQKYFLLRERTTLFLSLSSLSCSFSSRNSDSILSHSCLASPIVTQLFKGEIFSKQDSSFIYSGISFDSIFSTYSSIVLNILILSMVQPNLFLDHFQNCFSKISKIIIIQRGKCVIIFYKSS